MFWPLLNVSLSLRLLGCLLGCLSYWGSSVSIISQPKSIPCSVLGGQLLASIVPGHTEYSACNIIIVTVVYISIFQMNKKSYSKLSIMDMHFYLYILCEFNSLFMYLSFLLNQKLFEAVRTLCHLSTSVSDGYHEGRQWCGWVEITGAVQYYSIKIYTLHIKRSFLTLNNIYKFYSVNRNKINFKGHLYIGKNWVLTGRNFMWTCWECTNNLIQFPKEHFVTAKLRYIILLRLFVCMLPFSVSGVLEI